MDYKPVEIEAPSYAQWRKLLNGKPVRIKHGKGMPIYMSAEQIKKLVRATKKGSGMNLQFDPYQANLNNQISGKGFFKTLKKVTGINKSAVQKVAKQVGSHAIGVGSKIVGETIANYTGSDYLGQKIENSLNKAGQSAINSKSVKDALKNSGRSLKSDAKNIAIEAMDDVIDRNLSGKERDVAQRALAGKYPDARDLIYDVSDIALNRMQKGKGIGKAFKNLGREIKGDARKAANAVGRTAKSAGKDIEKGFIKASPYLEDIGKAALRETINYGVPAALAMTPMGPMAGTVAGSVASHYINDAIEKKIGKGAKRGRPRKRGGALYPA